MGGLGKGFKTLDTMALKALKVLKAWLIDF